MSQDAERDGFARRLSQRRLELGLTQNELGGLIGVSGQSVQQWEHGATSPRAARLERLANAMRVSRAWLLEGGGDGRYALRTIPLMSWDELMRRPHHPSSGERNMTVPQLVGSGSSAQAELPSFAVEVEQDAMTSPYPGQRSYTPGTVLIVEEREPITLPARVIARHRTSGALTFRELVEDSGQHLLRPYSPQYPVLDADEWEILGTVTSTQRPE